MKNWKYKVGTLRVDEPREVTESYECAAWHKTVRCEPGTYDVFAYLHAGNVYEGYLGHTLYAPFEGEVTSACFVSRIGAHYGSDRGPEEVGKKDRGFIKLSTFDLHHLTESGELVLDEKLVVAKPFVSESGKVRTFYRLRRDSETFRDDLSAACVG